MDRRLQEKTQRRLTQAGSSGKEGNTVYKGKMNTLVYGKCPFYKLETSRSITCEGFHGSGNCVLKFESEEEKNKYIEEHCYLYPNDCLICIGNDLKWEKEIGG